MTYFKELIFTFIFFYVSLFFSFLNAQELPYDTAKPWVVWHIMGSSLIDSDIEAEFEFMANSGLGGVCLVPIYGEIGDEKNYIQFLSDRWMRTLRFIGSQAHKNQLGVDMTMGTGWPFGGANVSEKDAAKKLDKQGNCTLTNQKVKRAAPGGEGLVLDPFSSTALKNYAKDFYKAFEPKENKGIVRAFFNDSFEVFGANWSEDFISEFKKRRGYDFEKYKNQLLLEDDSSTLDKDLKSRLWQDYHATIADMLLDNFTVEFTKIANKLGGLSKNQAHGSPANLCDLYAASDIPETESFGSSAFKIPLVRVDEDYEEKRFGRPNKLMMKFASSAANITGKQLVSSETGTWLANHFKVSLSQLKPQVDELFLGGINHIFWHGYSHTPKDKPFPGRLFYASTNFNVNSHFKHFFPELNSYVYESQKLLQKAVSDNDILVYFPIFEFWKERGINDNTLMFDVHHAGSWLKRCAEFENISKKLDESGFAFDFISDKQIEGLKLEGKKILSKNGRSYSAIVIPKISQIPLGTFEKLDSLAQSGAKIIFQDAIPEDVEALANLNERRQKAKVISANIRNYCDVGDVVKILEKENVFPEQVGSGGLQYIRKMINGAPIYFIANLSSKTFDSKVKLLKPCNVYFNPLLKKKYALDLDENNSFRLRLEAGQSCFLMSSKDISNIAKKYPDFKSEKTIRSKWQIDFIEGKPEIPNSVKMDKLVSWTTIADERAKYFSGTARYTNEFEIENDHSSYVLDLADLREMAEVFINGNKIGKVWCVPYKIELPKEFLQKGKNKLEVLVTNLSFNRIIKLDIDKVKWRNFREINFVDIKYQPFDASKSSPVDSGILGDVKILEYGNLDPKGILEK